MFPVTRRRSPERESSRIESLSSKVIMSRSHTILKVLRQVHLYVGVFTTPALLFFAITGALQTFSFHEQTRGSDYKPPAILVELGQLHKKQTTVVPVRRPPGPVSPGSGLQGPVPVGPERSPDKGSDPRQTGARQPGGGGSGHERPESVQSGLARAGQAQSSPTQPAQPVPPPKSHMPMKIFFLLVSISLVLSTLTGLYLSYKYSRGWKLITALLIAGLVIPILLLPY
jgi:hypothetical protein